MQNTLVCHHYGWTDIINTVSITNFLLSFYDKIYLIYHKVKEPFYLYYYRNHPQVVLLPFETPNDDAILIEKCLQERQQLGIVHFNFFGFYDRYRKDQFQGRFQALGGGDSSLGDTETVRGRENQEYYFVRKFYEGYGIPYDIRVSSFFLDRDLQIESQFFESFVHTRNYTLLHDTHDLSIPLEKDKTKTYYQLNQCSNLFFDAVKVLENADEIHLIDSVWAAVCYLLDAKYGILRHIPIYVYCLRGHQLMFTYPVKLPNWTLLDSTPRIIH